MVLIFNIKSWKMCKICSAVLKTLGGSTKRSDAHLSAKHGTKVQKDFNMNALPSTSQDGV